MKHGVGKTYTVTPRRSPSSFGSAGWQPVVPAIHVTRHYRDRLSGSKRPVSIRSPTETVPSGSPALTICVRSHPSRHLSPTGGRANCSLARQEDLRWSRRHLCPLTPATYHDLYPNARNLSSTSGSAESSSRLRASTLGVYASESVAETSTQGTFRFTPIESPWA